MTTFLFNYIPAIGFILGSLAVTIICAFVVKNHWRDAAAARDSNWTVEAFIITLGPIREFAQFAIGQDPSLAFLSPAIRVAELILLLAVIVGAVRRPRRSARTVLILLTLYYAALFLSGLFGATISLPEPYYLTALLVIFVAMNGTISADALVRVVQFSLRVFVTLSISATLLWPSAVFSQGDRTLFGLAQFQGIVSHPNGLAFLSLLGLLIELTRRGRFTFVILYGVTIIAAQSSTTYLLACAGILVIALTRLHSTRLLLVSAGVFVLVTVQFSGLGLVSLVSWLPSDFDTFTGRDRIWEAAIAGSSDYRLFGFGPTLLDEGFRATWLGDFDAAAQAHNQFVQDFAGAGTVGLMSLLALVAYLTISAARSNKASGGLTLALMVTIIGRMMTETPLRPTGLSLGSYILIATVGVVFAYIGRRSSTTTELTENPQTDSGPIRSGGPKPSATPYFYLVRGSNTNDHR